MTSTSTYGQRERENPNRTPTPASGVAGGEKRPGIVCIRDKRRVFSPAVPAAAAAAAAATAQSYW